MPERGRCCSAEVAAIVERLLTYEEAYACIWSDDKAAEMAKFYKSGTKVAKTSYWGSNPMGVKEGSVLTMHLTLLGQKIMLLNGFAKMTFNDSVSFVVPCKTQREMEAVEVIDGRTLNSGAG